MDVKPMATPHYLTVKKRHRPTEYGFVYVLIIERQYHNRNFSPVKYCENWFSESAVQKLQALQHFSEIQDGDCHQIGVSLICPIHQNGKKCLLEATLLYNFKSINQWYKVQTFQFARWQSPSSSILSTFRICVIFRIIRHQFIFPVKFGDCR